MAKVPKKAARLAKNAPKWKRTPKSKKSTRNQRIAEAMAVHASGSRFKKPKSKKKASASTSRAVGTQKAKPSKGKTKTKAVGNSKVGVRVKSRKTSTKFSNAKISVKESGTQVRAGGFDSKTAVRTTKSKINTKNTKKTSKKVESANKTRLMGQNKGGTAYQERTKTVRRKGANKKSPNKRVSKKKVDQNNMLGFGTSKKSVKRKNKKVSTKTTSVRTGGGHTVKVVDVKSKTRSWKPAVRSSKSTKQIREGEVDPFTTVRIKKKQTNPISAQNAAVAGAAGTGGYVTYKRRTKSGKTITVRRRKPARRKGRK